MYNACIPKIAPFYKAQPQNYDLTLIILFYKSARIAEIRMILPPEVRVLPSLATLRNDAVSAIIASANARRLVPAVVALEALADGVNT